MHKGKQGIGGLMKGLQFLIGLMVLLIGAIATEPMAQNLLNEPESVVYDSTMDRYLVSNFGNGAIVQIDNNGVQSYFNTELMPYYNVVGMHIKDGFLYASANGIYMGVKVFDLASGVMTGSIDIPGSFFLNDVTSDTSGYLYVTDFEANRIYKLRLSDYNVSTFVNTGAAIPNGLLFDAPNNRLLVGTHTSSNAYLKAVNLEDSTMTNVVDVGVQSDGVTVDDEGNIYISTWVLNSVFRYDPDFSQPRVTVASGFTSPADIFFNKKYSSLIVPNYNANRVDIIPMDVGLFTRSWEMPPVIGGATYGAGWMDIDNDGYPDLYLANSLAPGGQANGLFHNNDGNGFSAVTTGEIANDPGFSYTSTWGDCDNDGDLDVFVANGPDQANRLYLNNGDGSFSAATEGEIVSDIGNSRAASWVDYDNDGHLDLFVANSGLNSLFKNTGTSFEKITDNAIVAEADEAHGACWGDYNNDGWADLFVALPDGQNNLLYTNNGDATFTRVTDRNIVGDGGHSCGGSWGDYDNDGDLDLFVPNMSNQNNFLYNNNGDETFTRIISGAIVNDGGSSYGSSWGDYDTRGAAWADYDRDGDLDIVIARMSSTGEAENGFYRNNGNDNNWISVRCLGEASNGSAIGAKVRTRAVIGGEPVWQMREITAQSGMGSQIPLPVHFGLGDATSIDSLIIEWPTGLSQILTSVEVNQRLEITDYECGDANGDEQVNVGDAVFLIAYIFNGGPAPVPEIAGDANCDGGVNVGDAVYLIGYTFNGGPKPCATCL
jgi:sugar lactone lactonase YvrE